MDPTIAVALIGMAGLTVAAAIAGIFGLLQSRATAGHVRDIKDDTQQLKPNHGTSMYDLVNRTAAAALALQDTVQHVVNEQANVRADLATQQQVVKKELAQFRAVSAEDKERAREEATRMWAAIEAVAKAEPPTTQGD